MKGKTITNKTQEDGTYKLAQCSFGAGLLFERHATKNVYANAHVYMGICTYIIYAYQVVPGTRRGGSFKNRTRL